MIYAKGFATMAWMIMPIQNIGAKTIPSPPVARATMTIIASQAKPAALWPLCQSPTGPKKNPKHPATASLWLLVCAGHRASGRKLEYVRYRQPSIHAGAPAKIVGLDSAIRQIASSSDFCIRPKPFPFAGDVKIQCRRRCCGWGPARWTSRSKRTDLLAALVALIARRSRFERFPYRHLLAIVPCLPIQLNLTTRDGNTEVRERIGFDTDVIGFLDEVVHWPHGAVGDSVGDVGTWVSRAM